MFALEILAGKSTWLTPRHLPVLALIAGVLGRGAVRGLDTWWYTIEVDRAQREMASGRSAAARGRLARLAARWPDRTEVAYSLGVCEAVLGHVEPRFHDFKKWLAKSGTSRYSTCILSLNDRNIRPKGRTTFARLARV